MYLDTTRNSMLIDFVEERQNQTSLSGDRLSWSRHNFCSKEIGSVVKKSALH
jgi:hypothetical protein